jgi:hypothetical protein
MALFKNQQWAVITSGIESLLPAPAYFIDANRLVEQGSAGRGKLYDWPVHMIEKTWVDTEAFIEAFSKALEWHAGNYQPAANTSILNASIAEARRKAAEVGKLGGPQGENPARMLLLEKP